MHSCVFIVRWTQYSQHSIIRLFRDQFDSIVKRYRPSRWSSGSGVRLESGRPWVWFPPALGFFSGPSHTSDLKIGTPVPTLPGAWRYRVSPGTGWLGVSVLCWVRYKVRSVTSVSVWQYVHLSEQIRPWETLACCWDVKNVCWLLA